MRPPLCRWARSSHYNTGSDLFPQKEQQSYLVVNGARRAPRTGTIAGRSNSGRRTCSTRTMRRSRSTRRSRRVGRQRRRGRRASPSHRSWTRNIRAAASCSRCSSAEPRTFGLTLRARWASRTSAAPAYVPPPPPPPPPPPVVEAAAAAASAPAAASAAATAERRTRQLIASTVMGRPRPVRAGPFS